MKATGTNPRPFVPMKADSPHLKRFLEEAKRAAEYRQIKGYTDTHRTLVVTCEAKSNQSFTVGK